MSSSIDNVALVAKLGYDPGNPLFVDVVSIDLKADYNVAGILHFSDKIRTATADDSEVLRKGKTVVGVFPIDGKGLAVRYDATADTLFFQWGAYTGADGPLIDVPTGTMAGYTGIRLGVISQ